MAKKSKIAKNLSRQKIVERYSSKRKELKAILKSQKTSLGEKKLALFELEKMPRDANPIRVRNRCNLTGRPRGYYRKFGLSRIALREMAHKGIIPGITKASW